MPDVASLIRAIEGHRPRLLAPREGIERAAVAAVARDGADEVELLLIHRAEHPGDPWSGHMAFPGGRVDVGDADPLAAAVRETVEEVGLDLAEDGRLIGRLSDVRAVGGGRILPLVIEPYVFDLRGSPELVPNHEVADIVWVPVSFLLDERNRSTIEWRRDGATIALPCYRYGTHTIWGLTLIMLDELMGWLRAVACR